MTRKVLLISDSTGETLESLAQAIKAQFSVAIKNELRPLVRSKLELEEVFANIVHHARRPDIILYTLVDNELVTMIRDFAITHNIPVVDVLNPLIEKYAMVFGDKNATLQKNATPGGQHILDRAYFEKIEAMDFARGHDDGQNLDELSLADILILGVSRTSKSPTAAYLAHHRGFKVANVPYLMGIPLPKEVSELSNKIKKGQWQRTMIVGLTKRPEDLLKIRQSRLLLLGQENQEGNDYVNIEKIIEETEAFKKQCRSEGWAMIDVTDKSIEETAAHIVKKWQDRPSQP